MGVMYLGTLSGSSVPPGIWAYTLNNLPPNRAVRYNPAPAAAPSFRNARLLTIILVSSWYHGICRWPIQKPPICEIKCLHPTKRRGRISLPIMGDAHDQFPALASPVGTLAHRRYFP